MPCRSRFAECAWFRGGGGNRAGSPALRAAGLLLLALAAHLPALQASFIIDDAAYVTDDRRMESLAGLGRIWTEIGGPQYRHQYYPMTCTVFWLQHALWGERPFGYHLVNVLLHGANAVLLWRLLAALRAPGAWLAAAVFAVHPIHVQTVAWVAELKNVLSALFLLASMLVLVRWQGLDEPDGDAAPRAGRGRGTYALGAGLYAAALLSKSAACILPPALLVVAWWKRGRITRRDLLGAAPLAVLGLAMALVTINLETGHGGANGAEFAHGWMERTLIAGRSLWFYAATLAWPLGLSFVYPRWAVEAGLWWQWLFPAGAAAAAAAAWCLRRRAGRAPAAALAVYALAVAPLAFVDVAFMRHSFVSDHWAYLASLAPIALGAGAAARARWRRAWPPAAAPVAAALVVAALGGLAFNRALVYRTPESLWRDTIAANPGSWMAHNNLGSALMARGLIDEGAAHFEAAIRLQPAAAKAHRNLGNARQAQGRIEEAVAHFRSSIECDPDASDAHYNLGNALRLCGRLDEAVECYRRAAQLDPGYALAWSNLGAAELLRNRPEAAAAALREAVRADPGTRGASLNLGFALAAMGRREEALAHFHAALEAPPGDPDWWTRVEAALAAAPAPPEERP
jgi:tetratricopeptide (TPR) repeat protein